MSLTLSAIFWGVVTFSLLVVIHEGAHMFTARAFGVKVHEFFVGLPGPNLSFERGGTRYGVTAVPLGGYVKIAGMQGDSAHELIEPVLTYITAKHDVSTEELLEHFSLSEAELEVVTEVLLDWESVSLDEESGVWTARYEASLAEDPEALVKKAQEKTYLALSPLKRIIVLSAGVVANILCAVIVFSVVLAGWGSYQDLGHISPLKGGPAASAGVQDNDKIRALDSYRVSTFDEIPSTLSAHYKVGDTVVLTVKRGSSTHKIPVTLAKNPDSNAPYLGVSAKLTHVRPSIGEAIGQSFSYIGMTLKALGGLFNPATFKTSISQSTSVVGISVMAAQAASAGPLEYTWLIAAISLSLGIMNILPIPPLDGGKVVFEIIGALRKKPLSLAVQTGVSLAGFGLLFALVIFLTYNDFVHILG